MMVDSGVVPLLLDHLSADDAPWKVRVHPCALSILERNHSDEYRRRVVALRSLAYGCQRLTLSLRSSHSGVFIVSAALVHAQK
jgi:hypothetical protein